MLPPLLPPYRGRLTPPPGGAGVKLARGAAWNKVGLTSNMDVKLMTTLLHYLKRCSRPSASRALPQQGSKSACEFAKNVGNVYVFAIWGGSENDTNAHVLTQHELKLQCKFVEKRCKINVFGSQRGLSHGHKCTRADST